MTLCIAAACQEKQKSRVVIGTDWKISTVSATAEIQDKLYWIANRIPVLISGDVARAIQLIDMYTKHFKYLETKKTEIKAHNFFDYVRKPAEFFKSKLVNEYVLNRFGIDYKTFRKCVSANSIPETIAIDTYSEMSRIILACSLIVIWFWDDRPLIYRVYDDARGELRVDLCEHFACIGSGETIAESALYQREHKDDMTLGVTVYQVFEAMKLGSIASNVGLSHTINVIYPPSQEGGDVEMYGLTNKAQDFLEKQYKKFGPKPFIRFKLPEDSLKKEPT